MDFIQERTMDFTGKSNKTESKRDKEREHDSYDEQDEHDEHDSDDEQTRKPRGNLPRRNTETITRLRTINTAHWKQQRLRGWG